MITSDVFSFLAPEAVYPLLTFGIAVAGGTYAIWTAPRTKQLEILIRSHSEQLESWERRLKHDEEIIDELRFKLEECKRQHTALLVELADSKEKFRVLREKFQTHENDEDVDPEGS